MSRVLAFLSAVVMLAASAVAEVQTWQIDPNHTAAQFSVRHMGISTVRGAFTKVSGSAQYDPSDPSKTSVEATIDAASVDTRVSMRDNDLGAQTTSMSQNSLRLPSSQKRCSRPEKAS